MRTVIILKDRACALRKAAGLSQKELGDVLGLSQNAISTIEKLVLLAEFFHVSTDYLLGITDDPAWRGQPLE